jgi:hypothetical protein
MKKDMMEDLFDGISEAQASAHERCYYECLAAGQEYFKTDTSLKVISAYNAMIYFMDDINQQKRCQFLRHQIERFKTQIFE